MPLTRAQAAAQDGAWIASLQGFPILNMPPEMMLDILVRAGAWPDEEGQPLGRRNRDVAHKDMPVHSALSVCRQFRDALMGSAQHIAALLVGVHGGSKETALVRACTGGHEATVRHLLLLPEGAPRADCLDGEALLLAAYHGCEHIVSMLLEAPKGAARCDCRGGLPLRMSAMCGHESIVRLLLGLPEHALRGESVGVALALAAERGNVSIVRLLLGCGMPDPAFYGGEARNMAAESGHASVVRLLEEFLEQLGDGAGDGNAGGGGGGDGGVGDNGDGA